MKNVDSERDAMMRDYSQRLSSVTESKKRDCSALSRRITVLMQENAVLRSSIVSLKGSCVSSNEQAGMTLFVVDTIEFLKYFVLRIKAGLFNSLVQDAQSCYCCYASLLPF